MTVEIISGLKFGPLGKNSIHLCIDMQLMFAFETKWASESIWKALPGVVAVCSRYAARTVFTRFLCPQNLDETSGQWTHFYADATEMLGGNMNPQLMDLLPEVKRFCPPACIVDRKVFSAFASQRLRELLAQRSIDTLVISGFETDVCVLATILTAVDRGFRVVVVKDAIASSNADGEKAAINGVLPRFDQQIEVINSELLFDSWE